MQTIERPPAKEKPCRLLLLRGYASHHQTLEALQYIFRFSKEEATKKMLEASWSGEALLLESLYEDLFEKKMQLADIGAKTRLELPSP